MGGIEEVYAEAVKENKSRDISKSANGPRLTWWARWSSVATPILITVCLGVAGTFGDRFLTKIDRMGEEQERSRREQTKVLSDYKLEMAKSLGDITGSVSSLRGDMNVNNGHVADTFIILNSRLDSITGWTKKNADDIDKLRDANISHQR